MSETAQYIDSADVIIMPSDQPEPFGLIAIEAFARGRPVIASAAGGLLDIVTPGLNGWLYPVGDSTALAAVLATITRDEATSRGTNALRSYKDNYTRERFAQAWRSTVRSSHHS